MVAEIPTTLVTTISIEIEREIETEIEIGIATGIGIWTGDQRDTIREMDGIGIFEIQSAEETRDALTGGSQTSFA